ncbi:SDR family NAD(P)-dependent oxidoreductase, partial [Methylomagnum sp.]
LVLDQREDTYAKLLLQSKLTAWQRGDFLLVQPGERFEPNGDRRHRVRPDRPEDYAQLVEALRARRLMPGTVLVFGLTRDAGRPAERSLKELRALFLFTQALAKAKPERDIRLLYFGPTGLGTERPRLLAAAAGFGASVALEQRRLAFSAIDLPGDSAAEWVDSGRLVDVLKRELGAPASHGGAIRYQEGGRYRRGFEELAPPPAHGLPIRDGGTYLITGGLGGLGLICAEALAKRARVNLALAGRTAPGPAQMDALARIGARGGNVAHFAADIADWEATESLVRQVRERFGGLDGVLHAAGLIRDALLVNKAPGDFDAVLAPKILGAAHLDLATRGLPLDFFALFSSIAAMGGNLGQCDYAAGNAYLDALAAQREAQRQKGERHGRTVSIDWCLWEDGGMAVPEATRALMARATGLIALDRASGVDALARCLAADAPQVAVLAGGAGKLRRHFGLIEAAPEATFALMEQAAPMEARAEPSLAAAALNAQAEADIVRVFVELLKFDAKELDPDTGFTDYGIDSVMTMRLLNRFEEIYGRSIDPNGMLEHDTIRKLAAYLVASGMVRAAESAPVMAAPIYPVAAARRRLLALVGG